MQVNEHEYSRTEGRVSQDPSDLNIPQGISVHLCPLVAKLIRDNIFGEGLFVDICYIIAIFLLVSGKVFEKYRPLVQGNHPSCGAYTIQTSLYS